MVPGYNPPKMELDLKTFAIKQLEDVRDRYLQDLQALPDEAFDSSFGGSARTPAHFTYEIVCVNERFVKRLSGEDPGPFNPETWANTPDNFRSKAGSIQGFEASLNQVVDAVKGMADNEMLREIQTPGGSTNPYDLALFCASHVNYHDGQLNYIQALHGDTAVHWFD